MKKFKNPPLFLSFNLFLLIQLFDFGFCELSEEKSPRYNKIKTNLTFDEVRALEKFRPLVKTELYRDYMNEDYYLVTFLRARNLNLDQARDMLKQAHKWRRENRMDYILTEDWSGLEKYFPYFADGIDREGRPILTWSFGRWDIRRIALAGSMSVLNRYTDRMLEEGITKIREQREATGQDVTQYVIIIDGIGYSARTHACVLCLPFYYSFITHTDNYYPQTGKAIHLINVPRIFENVMQLIRPVMSKQIQDSLKVYGHDKTEWRHEFSKSIPLDQIRPQYGGTKQMH